MYSGSDSNESQKFPQWALNPATYQNLSNEQVDWAALAQQWIIMKESGPPPIPGEQPVIIKKPSEKSTAADMQVEEIAPPAPVWNVSEPPPAPGSETWGNYSQNPNWSWNNTWVQPTVVPPPPSISSVKPALLPTPTNSFSAPPESNSDNAVPFGSYNSPPSNESNHPSYWTPSSGHKHIKPHNKRYSKVNVPIRASAPLPLVAAENEPSSVAAMPSLDANKRKQLPAWIREGLEKMEKDKLRQIEKEKQQQEREDNLEKNKQTDAETMEILKSTMKERNKSRFDSDEDNSVEESKKLQRRQTSPEPIPLTPDELMLKVRRTMTEILLSVTNRHIEAVCREELQRFAKKRKASDQRSSAPSGANISSRLGLGMYAGDSASDSEEDEQRDVDQHESPDSDDDLKDIIKRKVSDFQKTERAIDDRLDEVERKKNEGTTRSPSPESNDNDSQVDARSQGANQYPVEKVVAPLPKSATPQHHTRSPSTSSERSVKSRHRSKSSSSNSADSYRKPKKSRRRSYSPDKRKRSRSDSPPKRRDSRRDSNGSKRDSNGSRRDSMGSRKKASRRSRSRSSSYYRRSRRSRSRSRSRSRYSKRSPSSSRSDRRRRRRTRRGRSRSESSGRGKRSHRH